jgi:8-oxo-dGTP pyrophosphatase MutT (NUDIX family)
MSIRFEPLIGNFDNVDSTLVTQVYGLVFNDENKLLIVHNSKNRLWQLPGGKPEAGESYYETLCRELIEEANIILDNDSIVDGFYQNVYKNEELSCVQLRCCARPKIISVFVSDPDESITEIKWINIEEIDSYLPWGKALDCIFVLAKKYCNK